MARMGRPSIFAPKNPKKRYQGITTDVGSKLFEAARARLAKLAGLKVSSVSDGDVFDFLARGEKATEQYLDKRDRT